MTSYRPATFDEARTLYDIFEITVDDLSRRMGYQANSTAERSRPVGVTSPPLFI